MMQDHQSKSESITGWMQCESQLKMWHHIKQQPNPYPYKQSCQGCENTEGIEKQSVSCKSSLRL